uniref:Ig-like V-type domain-containing protein FAM187A n=1 Tax=Solea senegalensis TaxID=28829 RepID=UPI001CD82458|nr:Ig-like V-type domain-containing protein FAM187A [Solea senegalensis]
MPSMTCSPLIIVLLLLFWDVWSYEAPEDKQDEFARRPCPAFLTFTNAAYLAGVTVELPCHCKPQQVQSVVWFYRTHAGSSEETRALTDHHGNKLLDTGLVPHSNDLRSRFAIRLFSLLIFRAQPDDSGLYICGSANKDFFFGYDVDIQKAHSLFPPPRLTPERTSHKQKQTKDPKSVQPLYRVFTHYRPWSVCDRCGVPGEQVRVGLCYIHSKYLHIRYRRANETVSSCGSGAVPKAFVSLKQNRVQAKLEVQSCQVTCPSQPTPSSKVLALMSFLGHSSASMPVEVPVFFLSHPADSVLTLGCPGARPNMAVAWDRGSEPIYRSDHLAGNKLAAQPSRLLIDTGHNLVFQPAKTKDSGAYYCWLQGRRAARINLLVHISFGQSKLIMSHPDFPAATKTLFISYAAMTAVFCLLLFGRTVVRYLQDTKNKA